MLWGSLGLFPLANVLYVPSRLTASNYVFGILKCFWILAKCFKSIVCQLPSVGRDDWDRYRHNRMFVGFTSTYAITDNYP